MNQIIESIFPAIISGILATVVTLFWQNRAKNLRSEKKSLLHSWPIDIVLLIVKV